MQVGEGSGVVTANGLSAPHYPYNFTFREGAQVWLEAVPAPGYLFKGWRGYLSGRKNPSLLSVTCQMNVTADFVKKETPALAISGGVIAVLVLAAVIVSRRKTTETESES